MREISIYYFLLFFSAAHMAGISAFFFKSNHILQTPPKKIHIVYKIKEIQAPPQIIAHNTVATPVKKAKTVKKKERISKTQKEKIIKASTTKKEPASLNTCQKIQYLASENICMTELQGIENYIALLAEILQENLTLPEKGDVELTLTLASSGALLGEAKVQSCSAFNQQYVIDALKSVHFPPFGKHLPLEKEHTFVIIAESKNAS
jgi:hypothetical protein